MAAALPLKVLPAAVSVSVEAVLAQVAPSSEASMGLDGPPESFLSHWKFWLSNLVAFSDLLPYTCRTKGEV